MTATNPLATERFRTIVTDALTEDGQSFPVLTAEPVLQHFTDAHFEYRVNGNGVAERRVAVASEWEVDPAPPLHLPEKGDVVEYLDAADGEGEWEVRAVPWVAQHDGYALLLLARPDWPEGKYMNTTAQMVRIVRRPAPTVRPGGK